MELPIIASIQVDDIQDEMLVVKEIDAVLALSDPKKERVMVAIYFEPRKEAKR